METRLQSWTENWLLSSKNKSQEFSNTRPIGRRRYNHKQGYNKSAVHPSMAPLSTQSPDVYNLQPTQTRHQRHPPRTPQTSNRSCPNCEKSTVNVLQRRWVYLLQGVVIFVLGLVLGIIYFCIRSVTATLQFTETIPSYIPSILLMMSGILAGLLFWKRENLLVIGALFLCLASTIICVACSVLALLQHIPLIKQMMLCSFDEIARQCHCYSNSFKDMTLYTFHEIANCDLLHTDLLDYHYTQCGLYMVTGLVCLISAAFHVLLLRFQNGRKSETPPSDRTQPVSVLQPVDVEHLANIQLLRSHMTGMDQSDSLYEYANDGYDNHGYDATTGIEVRDDGVLPPAGCEEPLVYVPADMERSRQHDPFSRYISLPGEPRVCLLGIRKRESIVQRVPEVEEERADAAENIDDLPVGASAQDLAEGRYLGTGQRSLPNFDEQILNGLELYGYQNRSNLLAAVRNSQPRHSGPSLSPSVAHSGHPSATVPNRPIRRCRCHDLPRRPLPRQPINSLPPHPITRGRNLENSLPRVPLRRGYPFTQTVSPQLQDYLEQCSRLSHASDMMPQRRPVRCARLAPRTRSCCSDDYHTFHYLPEFLALPEGPPPPYSLSPPYDNEHLPDYSSRHGTVRNPGSVTRTGLRRVVMPETEL